MKLTPIRAIKRYCKEECCAGDIPSWKFCTRKECPLYDYRIGKRPKNDKIAHSFGAKNSHSEEGAENA